MKKILMVALSMFFVTSPIVVSAQENTAMPVEELVEDNTVEEDYIQVWENLNREYEMNLPLHYLNEEKITIEEFEKQARNIIKSEKELLEYIEEKSSNRTIAENTPQLAAIVTKTRTQDTFALPNHFAIEARYTVNGNQIQSVSRSQIKYKTTGLLTNTYLTNISSPQYMLYIDGGRTLGVSYTANVHFDSVFGTRTTLYSEFYYSL